MAKPAADERTGVSALEHPAVRAWLRARPGAPLPSGVTLLKEKHKSAIYRLAGAGPGASAVVAKRCGAESARVERVVYESVLSRLPVSSLRYHGCAEGPDCCWLFLEECVADKYSSSLEEHRRLSGRWLGLLHTSATGLAGDVPLPDRGPAHYWACLRRVRDTIGRHPGEHSLCPDEEAVLASLAAGCDELAGRWAQVEQLCAEMPRTLVHGDFIKRNLRVRPGPGGPSLVAYDWEVAGWGVPPVDLAGPPFSGSPDLTAYWEVVREHWSGVDPPTIRRWAALGTLFRCLSAADWISPELAAASAEKAVARLAVHPGALAEAFRDLGWERLPVTTSLGTLPNRDALAAGLTAVFAGAAGLTVVDRQPNPHAATFPSEVVTCRLGRGAPVRLFCKYQTNRDNRAHGHRGGVAHEAEVYRRVLGRSGAPVPQFHGAHVDGPTGQVWLILEQLDHAVRLRDSKGPADWDQAAGWAGRFHAAQEGPRPGLPLSFLRAYDLTYYVGWAQRTEEYARSLGQDAPWLEAICRRFEAALGPLRDAPPTVIHGEYYPKNLLVRDGVVYPVDWESAAVGPGEIDLATLTDRCDPEVVSRCERAYREARWPEGAPAAFARTLDLARLYVHFRWLGDEQWRKAGRGLWRFEEIRALGERLGLL